MSVGLRPGEKLHEELFYDAERVEPTSISKVLRASAPPPPPQIREDVRLLLALATGEREDDLRIALLDYAGREVPEAADLHETSAPALQAVPIEVGDSPADLSEAVLAAMRAVPLDIGDPPQSASLAG
jgi:hypothetical protein